VRTGPEYGKLQIDHGATKIGSYDLYARKVRHQRIRFFVSKSAAPKTRTFTFRYTGHKNAAASATVVDLDALYATR
jgi:hypothetical protein